jgi:hypothetical protein
MRNALCVFADSEALVQWWPGWFIVVYCGAIQLRVRNPHDCRRYERRDTGTTEIFRRRLSLRGRLPAPPTPLEPIQSCCLFFKTREAEHKGGCMHTGAPGRTARSAGEGIPRRETRRKRPSPWAAARGASAPACPNPASRCTCASSTPQCPPSSRRRTRWRQW